MLVAFISTLIFLNNAINWWKVIIFTPNKIKVLKELANMSNFLTQNEEGNASNTITFKAGDKKQCYDITHKNTVIVGSVGNHDHGSSKVKLKNIVDYKWETKNYPGHLIAVHQDGKHIAYVIKVNNKLSGTEGMVRVANVYSGQRALIKGMSGEVLDLQFAHIEKEHLLACIEEAVLHIHKIDVSNDSIKCVVLLKIEDLIPNYTPKYDKISWCPYVPDEASDDDEDISQLIIWARGTRFQCFNINIVVNNYGPGNHLPANISDGYLQMSDNAMIITWVALSPDGTTLGVGSEDGYIRFYQVYLHEKEPRCLHQWNPHDGKPISSFFFLDNLSKTATDAYWKYALTGADHNTEFKIWDCGTWECLQTVSFTPLEGKSNNFIAEIDRTSSYLVLSNLETRGLYVLQIINEDFDKVYNNEHNFKKKSHTVFLKSVSEFPLSSPILSFSIVDAAVRKYKCALSDNYLLDELDDYDEENNAIYCVVVRMCIVQPKSVQECHILYQPTLPDSAEVKSSISNESMEEFRDGLSDISTSLEQTKISKTKNKLEGVNKTLLEKKSKSISPPQKLTSSTDKVNNTSPRTTSIGHTNFSQVNLMTPESFSSSGKKSPECVSSEVLSTILMLASVTGTTSSNNKTSENINLLNLVNNKMIEDQEQQKLKQTMNSQKTFISSEGNSTTRINSEILASGGSSPSREVQEILSLKDYNKEVTNFFDNGNEKTAENIDTNVQTKQTVATEKKKRKEENCFDQGREFNDQIKKSSSNDWPKVPDVRSVTKHSVKIPSSTTNVDNSAINELNSKINKLIDTIQLQSQQITELKNEVCQMRNIKVESSVVNGNELTYKIEKQLSKLLEEYFISYDKQQKQKLDSFLVAKDAQNRELLDNVLHMLNQFIFNQFTEKLSNLLIGEIQRHMVPVIAAKLDVMKQQIQADVAQKLTTTDKLLKDNIAQVCRSKSIIDAFGNSVLLGVQNGLQSTYVESMTNTLIPAYEKSSQEMFKQLHGAFSLGIKEVMEQFDNYLSQLQPVQETTDEILEKVVQVSKVIESSSKSRNNSNDMLIETRKEIKNLESKMTKALSDVIQGEIRKSFESQAASLEDSVLSVVRSQAHTPAPSLYDIQDQIKHLLSQNQINKAFHQALLANDLSLVEYTLEKADYRTVFNPCVLEQTVLLSLIQQISADMNNHNEIKQRYLSDGILNLNQVDPITKEHAPKVMKELYRNCQCFLGTNPKSPLCSNVRMIMMAVQGMGYKIF